MQYVPSVTSWASPLPKHLAAGSVWFGTSKMFSSLPMMSLLTTSLMKLETRRKKGFFLFLFCMTELQPSAQKANDWTIKQQCIGNSESQNLFFSPNNANKLCSCEAITCIWSTQNLSQTRANWGSCKTNTNMQNSDMLPYLFCLILCCLQGWEQDPKTVFKTCLEWDIVTIIYHYIIISEWCVDIIMIINH